MYLEYHLTKKNIEQSLICLSWKKEKRKKSRIVVLTGISIYFLVQFARNPKDIFSFLILFFSIMLMLLLLYYPIISRKKRTIMIAKQKGIYCITITQNGIEEKKKKYLFKDFNTTVLESEDVYTIQLEKEVYCIPKTLLGEGKEKEFQSILKSNGITIMKFKTRGKC